MKNFVIVGSCGYIAPRHIKAISQTNNNLMACFDIRDDFSNVNNVFPNANCFVDFESFSKFVNKKKPLIDFIVICSPNYLHFKHCSWAAFLFS